MSTLNFRNIHSNSDIVPADRSWSERYTKNAKTLEFLIDFLEKNADSALNIPERNFSKRSSNEAETIKYNGTGRFEAQASRSRSDGRSATDIFQDGIGYGPPIFS